MARLYRGGPIRLVFLCLCDHSFRRRLRWERNGTQGESADGRYGGLCGDRIGCRRFPRLPNGRADGRRERLAVRCLRVRLVLHVRRYQVLPAMAVVEAVRSETILGQPARPSVRGRLKSGSFLESGIASPARTGCRYRFGRTSGDIGSSGDPATPRFSRLVRRFQSSNHIVAIETA
jgi:hypothetical protein